METMEVEFKRAESAVYKGLARYMENRAGIAFRIHQPNYSIMDRWVQIYIDDMLPNLFGRCKDKFAQDMRLGQCCFIYSYSIPR